MKNNLRFRWILFSVGISVLATAITVPVASRADEAHDQDRPQLDGSIEQVLNRLSNRFHVHIDADWNELQAEGVSPQLSLQNIPAKTLDDGLAAVVSATHFRVTYVSIPGSVRISAGALAPRPAATVSPVSPFENRHTAAASDDSKSDDVLDRMIPDLNLDSVTFEDALSRLAEATHANIVVHWRALTNASINPLQKMRLHLWNVSLRTALRVILAEADNSASPKIGFVLDDEGVLDINSVESIPGHGVIRFYNVRDLLKDVLSYQGATDETTKQAAVDSIITLITNNVDPDSWRDAGGSIGTIKEIEGILVVAQTAQGQAQIATLLDGLRQHGLAQ